MYNNSPKAKQDRTAYKSFMIEIITSILFFAIFCSVAIKVFAVAQIKNAKSIDLNNAMLYCQSVMEQVNEHKDNIDSVPDVLNMKYGGESNRTKNTYDNKEYICKGKYYNCYLDKNMMITEQNNSTYFCNFMIFKDKKDTGYMYYVEVYISKKDDINSIIFDISDDIYYSV